MASLARPRTGGAQGFGNAQGLGNAQAFGNQQGGFGNQQGGFGYSQADGSEDAGAIGLKFREFLGNPRFKASTGFRALVASGGVVRKDLGKDKGKADGKSISTSSVEEQKGLAAGRLDIDLSELDAFQTGLSKKIMKNPFAYLPVFDDTLADMVFHEDQNFGRDRMLEGDVAQATVASSLCHVAIKGVYGANHVTPRGLTSALAGQLVCVEGIAIRCSTTRPRARVSVHFVADTGDIRAREHRDMTCLVVGDTGGSGVPTVDTNGNRYQQAYGLSLYKDFQKLTLQEMPESAPTGQMPKSVEILLADDLVDSAKPGDRVAITGVYKPIAYSAGGVTTGVFKFVVVANRVMQLRNATAKGFSESSCISKKDVVNFEKVAGREDTFELLSRSFAPSIGGRTLEKKGLLLQAFGGVEKSLKNGTHLRGDVNVLLVGDPSCGKSQLLRFVMAISPLCVSTTGRGSSGVGLTAAVNVDKETGEKILEAGAMVLADRGVVCIDEFDKMSVADRVAIHEVMEQQTVTIAKAGIHTTLNARCSVLAAANPVYGNFDPSLDLNRNIHLPDSILSRFDLIYVVRDAMDKETDRMVSSHVLRQLRFRTANSGQNRGQNSRSTAGGDASSLAQSDYLETRREIVANDEANRELETQVFDKNLRAIALAALQKDGRSAAHASNASELDFVTVDFIKKYIAYCRSQPAPALTEAAVDAISDTYTSLRQACMVGTVGHSISVTPRTLESFIRLATAHAKLKLKPFVDTSDVEVVKRLVFATRGMGAEVEHDQYDRQEVPMVQVESDTMAANKENSAGMSNRGASLIRKRAQQQTATASASATATATPVSLDDVLESVQASAASADPKQSRSQPVNERMSLFGQLALGILSSKGESMPQVDLTREVNSKVAEGKHGKRFTESEAIECIRFLVDENKVFVAEDIVYLTI